VTRRTAFISSAACLLVVLLLGVPNDAAAYCQMTTVAPNPLQGSCSGIGKPLAWTRRCIEYALDMRGSTTIELDDLSDIVAGSFGTWLLVSCDDGAPGFQIQESALANCTKAEFNQDGTNVNVIAFVPDLDDGPILALTTVWYQPATGEIIDADILVNESQGPFAACPPLGCFDEFAPHDLANVLTHEVGHFFGLAHSTDLDATMYASSSSGETNKRSLEVDDEAGFCATYGAAELSSECNFVPRGGRGLTCEGSSRGCAVVAPSAGGPGSSPAFAWLLGVALTVAWGRRRLVGRIDRARARLAPSDTLRPRD
jgi:hypothetical protein